MEQQVSFSLAPVQNFLKQLLGEENPTRCKPSARSEEKNWTHAKFNHWV